MTHSAPALAKILETFDPGIICHTPIDGPLLAWKACFSLLDWSIVEWVAMALDDRKRIGGGLENDGRIEWRQRNDDDTSFLRHKWLVTVGVIASRQLLIVVESRPMEPWTAGPLGYHLLSGPRWCELAKPISHPIATAEWSLGIQGRGSWFKAGVGVLTGRRAVSPPTGAGFGPRTGRAFAGLCAVVGPAMPFSGGTLAV